MIPENSDGSAEGDGRDGVEVGDGDQVPHDGRHVAEVVRVEQTLLITDHDEHGKTFNCNFFRFWFVARSQISNKNIMNLLNSLSLYILT